MLDLPPPPALSATYDNGRFLYPWHRLLPGESIFFTHPTSRIAQTALRSYLRYLTQHGFPTRMLTYHHRMVYGIWGLVVTRPTETGPTKDLKLQRVLQDA